MSLIVRLASSAVDPSRATSLTNSMRKPLKHSRRSRGVSGSDLDLFFAYMRMQALRWPSSRSYVHLAPWCAGGLIMVDSGFQIEWMCMVTMTDERTKEVTGYNDAR